MSNENSLIQKDKTSSLQLSTWEEARVWDLREKQFSDSTQEAYARDWKAFAEWARDRGASFPSDSKTMLAYVVHLDSKGFKVSTIHRKVYSVSKLHKYKGYESPIDDQVKEVLLGIRKEKREEGKTQAPALTKDLLTPVLKELYQSGKVIDIRDRALVLVGWLGAFRSSELISLRWNDLKEDKKGFTALVRHSKTDQEGKGLYKIIPYKSEPFFCPVRALKAWREYSRGEYIFTGVTKGGGIAEKPIGRRIVGSVVKKHFGKEFSSHSLRAGFITSTALNRSTYSEIMAQTGHKDIRMIETYKRPLDAWEGNAALNV